MKAGRRVASRLLLALLGTSASPSPPASAAASRPSSTKLLRTLQMPPA
jgi:hypothetical protein